MRSQAIVSVSPWDGREVGRVVAESDASAVVDRLARVFPAWSRSGDRRERLRALAAALERRRAAIVDLLVREAGKTIADAVAECDLLPRKVAITLEQSLARTPLAGEVPVGDAPQAWWRPRGVAVVLGPFNFPLHLLHGLVVPALAVGCTVAAKPSERCPALGALYAEAIADADLGEVCAVVQGGRATAEALIDHGAVATVALVGGRATGVAIARRLAARPEVVLALELGGVNPALVLEDGDLPAAAAALAEGAWRMAGQRCTATRVAHVPRAALPALLDALTRERQRWLPAASPEATGSGPMISVAAREGFQAPYRQLPSGLRLLAGDPAAPADGGCRCDPLLLLAEGDEPRRHPLLAEEQFGPALVVDPYDDLDACVQRMRAQPYRLCASVFTASAERFAALAAELPFGQVNRNRPTAGARSDQPFGGLGRSGNGRPAAVAACAIFADECTVWP